MTPVRGRLTLLLAALSVVGTLAGGSAAYAFNDQTAVEWSENYYLSPEPDRVPEAIAYLRSRHIMSVDNRHARGLIGLFAAIFHDHPQKIELWLADVGKYSPDEQKMLLQSAWLSDTAEGRAVLAAQGPERLSRLFGQDVAKVAPPSFANLSIDDPTNVDILWGHFYGTGDGADVRRIIAATKNIGQPTYIKDKVNLPGKISSDAVKNLTKNSINQPKVFAVVRAEATAHPNNITLKNIVLHVQDEQNHVTAVERAEIDNPKPPCEAYTICKDQ